MRKGNVVGIEIMGWMGANVDLNSETVVYLLSISRVSWDIKAAYLTLGPGDGFYGYPGVGR